VVKTELESKKICGTMTGRDEFERRWGA